MNKRGGFGQSCLAGSTNGLLRSKILNFGFCRRGRRRKSREAERGRQGMNVRAWLAPGPPIVPFPPKTEPCGRIDAFVPPNGEGDAPGALKAFGCVVVVPKGELVVEAPNAEGEAAGAPKGDAGAAPKAPAGLPNAPGLLPPPKAPPPPKPPENVMLSGTRAQEVGRGVFEFDFFIGKAFIYRRFQQEEESRKK